MSQKNTNNLSWWLRVKAELCRDRKKTIALGVLLAAAGLLGGRLIFQQIGPARADGALRPTAIAIPQPDVPSAVSPEPSKPTDGAGTGTAARKDGIKVTRDLFQLSPTLFPPEERAQRPVLTEGQKQADGAKEQARRKRIQAAAGQLVLQSTIVGSSPMAILNGHVVRAGKSIDGFCVLQVTSHTCVVEKDGVKVTLGIKGYRASNDSERNRRAHGPGE